jgi:copper chaperone CopZ
MRLTLLLSVGLLAALPTVQAESSIKLQGVHNCCKSCEKGINSAISKVSGATAEVDGKTVTVKAADEATAKKAVSSLLEGGYFGVGATATIADAKVKSATVDGLHLCCGKCVTAAEKAILSVPGVTAHNAEKGSKSVKIDGDFSTAALQKALNEAGFNGAIK